MKREEALKVAKPILLNAEMVWAIQDGRKTVTRRLIKHPYYIDNEDVCRKSGLAMHVGINATDGMPYPDSPYKIGDILCCGTAPSRNPALTNSAGRLIRGCLCMNLMCWRLQND